MFDNFKTSNEKKGIFFTFISVALISLSPVLHKLGLNHVKPIYGATLWCFFSALFSFTMVKKTEIIIPQKILFILLKMAVSTAMGILFLFCGLNILDPSTVAFANRSYILFVILLGIFVLKEPVTQWQLVLFAVNFMGLLLFSYKGLYYTKYTGLLCVILSAFLLAFSNMNSKNILKNISPAVVNFYSHFFSFLVLLPVSIILEVEPFQLNSDVWYIILSAFTAGFLGMYFYYKGLFYYSFSLSGVIRAFSPVLTTLYALPFFGLSYSSLNVVGIILLIVSSVSLLKGPSKKVTVLKKVST